MMPEASARVLADYVRDGGVLVAEARLGWNNERGYASERIPGMGLWEVMGTREAAIETAPNGRTTIRWTGSDLPGLSPGTDLPARWYKETLEPSSSGARIVAQFSDGSPAAVMSVHGKGRTLMIGSYVAAAAQSTPTAEAGKFFAGLLAWADVDLPLRVTGAAIEARTLESGGDTLLFLFNHDRQPATSEVWLRGTAGSVSDIFDGHRVEFGRSNGGVIVRVDLAPGDVRVLRVGLIAGSRR
jgi:beta-galactosidase